MYIKYYLLDTFHIVLIVSLLISLLIIIIEKISDYIGPIKSLILFKFRYFSIRNSLIFSKKLSKLIIFLFFKLYHSQKDNK